MATLTRLIILLFAVSSFAQTGLPSNKNRAKLIAEVIAVRDSIMKCEAVYFAKYGRYFQGIPPDTIARDISLTLKQFDRFVKPTDQAESWADFGLRDISVLATYWVDAYDGPRGHGYVMNASIAYGTDVYTLSQNVGPETWRDSNLKFIKTSIVQWSSERL